jgi:hypothetical protein
MNMDCTIKSISKFGLLLAFITTLSFSQSIQLSRTVINPITGFDLSYLDLNGTGKGPTLFTFTLLPANPPNTTRYQIHFEINLKTETLNEKIYAGVSRSFTIPNSITRTSNQFFDQTNPDDSIGIDHPTDVMSNERVQSLILNAGAISTGSVVFDFKLVEVLRPGNQIHARLNLDIANIRYVKLMMPGSDVKLAGSQTPLVYSLVPQFVWSSDLLPIQYGNNQVKFVISLYENVDDAYSVSDVVKGKPIWTQDVYNANFAQYPTGGVRTLTEGKTYFWQVKGILQGPRAGEISSEVFTFKIANFQYGQGDNPLLREISKSLDVILGSGFGYILDEVKELQPAGGILLNGQSITLEQLRLLAGEFSLKEWTIRKVNLE